MRVAFEFLIIMRKKSGIKHATSQSPKLIYQWSFHKKDIHPIYCLELLPTGDNVSSWKWKFFDLEKRMKKRR